MDHALSSARQRAVLAIAQQQAQVRQEAQKQLQELQSAIDELRDLYVGAAGLEGQWQLTQNDRGEIVLRPVEKAAPPAEEAKVADGPGDPSAGS